MASVLVFFCVEERVMAIIISTQQPALSSSVLLFSSFARIIIHFISLLFPPFLFLCILIGSEEKKFSVLARVLLCSLASR